MLELGVLFFSGLVCPLEVSVSSGSIQVARGQTAVLPCTFTTNAALTNLNVIWMVIPLSNANQPQQVGIFLLECVFLQDFPFLHPFHADLDVDPLQSLVFGCSRTPLPLHCWRRPLGLTWIWFLQCFVDAHCVLGCLGRMCNWGTCMWYYRAALDLWWFVCSKEHRSCNPGCGMLDMGFGGPGDSYGLKPVKSM